MLDSLLRPWSSLLLLLLLAGCQTGAPPVSAPPATAVSTLAPSHTPTASPTPTIRATRTPTPTASPTPSATPSPTPTPRPAALREQADTALHNGDYAAAIALYDQVVAAEPSPALKALAQWQQGQARWYDGQEEAALQSFVALAADTAFRQQHPQVYYWLGRAYAAGGQPELAAEAWRIYAEQQPLLGGLAYERAGDAYAAHAQPVPALAHYEVALKSGVGLVAELRIREKMAQASLQMDDAADAIAHYRAILNQARNPAYRTEIFYRLGQAQLIASQDHAAMLSFHQATITAPDNAFAYLALIVLVDTEEPVDALLRARIDVAAGAVIPALTVLRTYLAENEGHSGEAHALMAQAYEQLGQYARATAAWQMLIETHPADQRLGEAWLGRARDLWRLGDVTAAREVYLAAANTVDDPATAAKALWWAGVLAERDEGNLAEAVRDFERLWRRYPQSRDAGRAGFRAGLALWRLQRLPEAQAVWQEVAVADAGLWSAAADFWLGRLLLQQEGKATARAHWRGTEDRWGIENYYGVRATQWLRRLGPTPVPSPTPTPSIPDLSAWLTTWVASATPIDLSAPRSEMERPIAMYRAGELQAAYAVFRSYRQAWRDDPVYSLSLALLSRDLGYYDISIRAAARVAFLSGMPLTALPGELQRLIYPVYFPDLIAAAARRYDLDEAVLLALVRQESHFGTTATSLAAASGLTQVIPSTGRAIARQLDFVDYEEALLYRPYVSVEFGAYYLAQGIEQAEGSVMQALAGYNGGPGNAAFWRQQSGADDDLFLELISFDETQSYVRLVLWQAELYRRMYPHLH